MLFLGTSIL